MSKDLKEKAISIKGKQYVLVSDRVVFFNDNFQKGCIVSELLKWENNTITILAKVYPEGLGGRYFTGFAQEVIGEGNVNKTSALENAETSAVGRALAMMGIGVIDSISSVDEINKADNRSKSNYTEVKKQVKAWALDGNIHAWLEQWKSGNKESVAIEIGQWYKQDRSMSNDRKQKLIDAGIPMAEIIKKVNNK